MNWWGIGQRARAMKDVRRFDMMDDDDDDNVDLCVDLCTQTSAFEK